MYHQVLKNQMLQFLPKELQTDARLSKFLQAIEQDYISYEDELKKSQKVSCESEKDNIGFQNNRANEELLKQKTVDKLQEVVSLFGEVDGVHPKSFKDDIFRVSEFINLELRKRKSVSETLKDNNKFFKTLLASMQSAVMVEDEHRRILFCNDLFCKIFGAPCEPEFLVGQDCCNTEDEINEIFLYPDQFKKGLDLLLKNRVPVFNERVLLKNGRILNRDYVPIDIGGKPRGHLWQYTDITETEQNIRALRESELLKQQIMDQAMDAILLTDDKGTMICWNPAAEVIFGMKESDIVGRSISEIIISRSKKPKEPRDILSYYAEDLEQEVVENIEMIGLNANGKKFAVEIHMFSFIQNGNKLYCSFVNDITERRMSEMRTRKQEERFRHVITNMNLGFAKIDLEGRVSFANQSFVEMTGYTLDEILGQTLQHLVGNENNAGLFKRRLIDRKQLVSEIFEIEISDKFGKRHWWLVSAAPNFDDKGDFVGSISIHLDISSQKIMENELAAAKRNAEAAAKAKELFFANMSHEIRTPLNVIIGMIRHLAQEPLNRTQNVFVAQAEGAARHLLTMLNNVLDIAKIESGELDIINRPFSPSSLIQNLHSILSSQVNEKNLDFVLNINPDIKPAVKGDETRIRQVLLNMIGNAVKFTDVGSITLTADVLDETENTQSIYFEVKDTGIGMSKQFIHRIFDKFSQEENPSNRKNEGFGLGMAISSDLLELMGSKLNIVSRKNEGTKLSFVVNFEIADASELLIPLPKLNKDKFKNRKVLLAEDNDMNRFIAKHSLNNMGFDVTEAENGQQAIDFASTSLFDLILMDIQMPLVDGVEATLYLRNQLNLDTPIVALTANAFRHEIDLYLASGMNDYITKPYDEIVFYQKVEEVLIRAGLEQDSNSKDVDRMITLKSPLLYDLKDVIQMSQGDSKFVKELVMLFRKLCAEHLPRLHEVKENEDLVSLKKLIHKMKPSVEQMGISSLKSIFEKIENKKDSGGFCEDTVKNVEDIISILGEVNLQLDEAAYY